MCLSLAQAAQACIDLEQQLREKQGAAEEAGAAARQAVDALREKRCGRCKLAAGVVRPPACRRAWSTLWPCLLPPHSTNWRLMHRPPMPACLPVCLFHLQGCHDPAERGERGICV